MTWLAILALLSGTCHSWRVLSPSTEITSQLSSHVTTSNWTFVIEGSADVVVDDGSLLRQLPGLPEAQLYQYLYTGVDRLLPQIPPHFTVAACHQAVDAISEWALAAILDWTINLAAADHAMRRCAWDNKSSADCASASRINHRQLKGQVLGILGYGHIGSGIASRAAAFGMKIIGTTLHPPAEPPSPLAWLGGAQDAGKLVEQADFVVVCVPDVPSTLGMVNAALIKQMKPDSVLINIASARVIDQAALYNALRAGAIGGAVLDTWWNRDWRNASATGEASWPSAFRFDLLNREANASRVVMDPTMSSHTNESDLLAIQQAAANLDAFARGLPLNDIVRNSSSISAQMIPPVAN